MFTSRLMSYEQMVPYIIQFHIYGHGIENGVSEEEHLKRVLNEAQDLIGLLILKDGVPITLVTLFSEPVEDCHFVGCGIACVHIAGPGLGVSGGRYLHKQLREMVRATDSQWYSMSWRVSRYEYRNRYYMVGENQ